MAKLVTQVTAFESVSGGLYAKHADAIEDSATDLINDMLYTEDGDIVDGLSTDEAGSVNVYTFVKLLKANKATFRAILRDL